VPIVYKTANSNTLLLFFKNGTEETIPALELDAENSKKIFDRTGEIITVKVSLNESTLR
jgi:hypothetical protein